MADIQRLCARCKANRVDDEYNWLCIGCRNFLNVLKQVRALTSAQQYLLLFELRKG